MVDIFGRVTGHHPVGDLPHRSKPAEDCCSRCDGSGRGTCAGVLIGALSRRAQFCALSTQSVRWCHARPRDTCACHYCVISRPQRSQSPPNVNITDILVRTGQNTEIHSSPTFNGVRFSAHRQTLAHANHGSKSIPGPRISGTNRQGSSTTITTIPPKFKLNRSPAAAFGICFQARYHGAVRQYFGPHMGPDTEGNKVLGRNPLQEIFVHAV